MAPFDSRPPNVLVLGGGGLLGEAWMTGVLAGYEDATGADVRGCQRFVGTSAGSIVAASLVAGRSPRRPGSAKASAIPPGESPGGAPPPFADASPAGRQGSDIGGGPPRGPARGGGGGATVIEHRRRRRSARRPGRRADPRAGAAGPPGRAAVDRRVRGRGRQVGRDVSRGAWR